MPLCFCDFQRKEKVWLLYGKISKEIRWNFAYFILCAQRNEQCFRFWIIATHALRLFFYWSQVEWLERIEHFVRSQWKSEWKKKNGKKNWFQSFSAILAADIGINAPQACDAFPLFTHFLRVSCWMRLFPNAIRLRMCVHLSHLDRFYCVWLCLCLVAMSFVSCGKWLTECVDWHNGHWIRRCCKNVYPFWHRQRLGAFRYYLKLKTDWKMNIQLFEQSQVTSWNAQKYNIILTKQKCRERSNTSTQQEIEWDLLLMLTKSVKTVGVLLLFCFRSANCLNWLCWKAAMNYWLATIIESRIAFSYRVPSPISAFALSLLALFYCYGRNNSDSDSCSINWCISF